MLFLCIFGLAIQGILAGVLSMLNGTAPPTDAWRSEATLRQAPPLPAGPRLQISAPAELEFFRNREEAELHSYGWINRKAGVVRIPIERAMDLILQEGLPARTNANQAIAGPSADELIRRRADHREPEIKGQP